MKKVLAALALASVLLLAGCVEVTNLKIKVASYSGDCSLPIKKIPCCDSSDKPNFKVYVDDKAYSTNSNGEILLKTGGGIHTLSYSGCSGNETTTVNVTKMGVVYEKTLIYGNGAYEKVAAKGLSTVEINLPCCTQ